MEQGNLSGGSESASMRSAASKEIATPLTALMQSDNSRSL